MASSKRRQIGKYDGNTFHHVLRDRKNIRFRTILDYNKNVTHMTLISHAVLQQDVILGVLGHPGDVTPN